MRIDIVTDTFLPDVNGVAMTLGKLVFQLKSFGHKVHVIHTGDQADLRKGETKVRSFALPGYAEVKIGLPSYIKLKRRWEDKRPDVVYVATESTLGASALKATKRMQIPAVSGFHTNFHEYMRKYKLSLLKGATMSYLRNVHDKADLTLTPSMDALDMLEESGFKNVKLLGRGVDSSMFSSAFRSDDLRREWGAEGDDPVVIIVGRVAPEKNLDFALKSLDRHKKERFPRLQVVIVGDGPLRKKLEERYAYVHFAGMRSGEDLSTYYASADLMLFASETETFGNVMTEAMASRLVTVSYRYAASRMYIEDQKNGFSAEKGNEEELFEKIGEALDSAFSSSIRDAATATVRGLTWENVGREFESYLTQVVEARAGGNFSTKSKHKIELRSLFISDVHLGSAESQATELTNFLKRVSVERIYLNGDIIDSGAMKRGGKWTKQHTKVIRTLLKKMEKEDTELIYLRGNNDEILDRVLPLDLSGLKVVTEINHSTLGGKKYLVVHGDGFDSFSTNHKWVAKFGAVGYGSLLKINRVHNRYRKWRGKGPYSLSKIIRSKVKGAASFVESYQTEAKKLAQKRGCDGIIVGHIHTPADKDYDGIHYLNSGDWVGSASCVVEYLDGELAVLEYADFLKMLEAEAS